MDGLGIVVNDPQRTSGDDNLAVKFLMQSVKNNFRSEKEGHACFDEVLMISTVIPGIVAEVRNRKATDFDKERFPKQWASFQRGTSDKVEGVPLEEWPMMTRSRAEELKHQKFYSVEQLAAASDAQLQGIGPDGYTLRTKAKAYLANAKDSAVAINAAAENEKLKAENERLNAVVADIGARLKAIEDGAVGMTSHMAAAKRRGRPPKAA